MSKRILVVDDEPNIVKMIESRLVANDYEVFTASNGMDGLSKAKEHCPDLIILDILMPEMDGTAMATAMKDDPATKSIPVIFLTCLIEKNQEKDTRHIIGGNVFFAKPFTGAALLDKIEEIIGK